MKQVKSDSQVYVHMTLSLDDGSIAESSRANGKPAIIELGTDAVSEAMEQHLVGMKEGDKKKFKLTAADAFGETDPNFIQFMDISQFPQDIELSDGAMIAFEQPNGSTMPGIVRSIEGHSVKVDFNHPLAGHSITFEIELLSIDSPPTTH
ncbi:MAG: FKBP-type peptidyl-prolyl cis-trans isomerase [Gammaproteobacteria bacterium]|nr:FKBP-type peptidyl-prolyl cis-trans isomerase [Gammaproteobacteria bacterium]